MKNENKNLSKEEREIERDIRKGLYRPVSAAEQKRYVQMAKEHVRRASPMVKSERVNIRIRRDELARLKERAEQVGLPYQSLIASVLHRYLNGSLVEVDNIKTIVKALKGPARSRKST
jgi:predicted DNA binding CopG/RHH family protein